MAVMLVEWLIHLRLWPQPNPELRTQDTGLGTQNSEPKTRVPDTETDMNTPRLTEGISPGTIAGTYAGLQSHV